MKCPASSNDRYSTRPTRASRQSGVQLDKFDAPPAERNTGGFQPPAQSQIKPTTSTVPTSASTARPRSIISVPVGITAESTIVTAHTTPVTSQGADPKSRSALQDKAQNAGLKVAQSGTGQPKLQHLQPTRQIRQAAVVKASGQGELYGASDEDAANPATPAIQPTDLQGRSFDPVAHHTGSTLTGTKVTIAENGSHGPNQVTSSSRLTSPNERRALPEDVAGQPNRDSGSSKNPILLTPMPAATLHINLNAIPKYAWNKGVNPKYQKTPRASQYMTAVDSANRSSRQFEQGREDDVNEASFTAEPNSKVVRSTGLAERSDEDIHAAGAKLASGGVQEPMDELQKAHAETDHFTPPHLRVPKPRPDPSRPITATTVSPAFSPQGNEPPSHVASMSTTAVTPSRDAINAPKAIQPDHSRLPPHMRPPKFKKSGQLEPNDGPISHAAVGNHNSAKEEVKSAEPTSASGAQIHANGQERVLASTEEEKPNIRGGDIHSSRDVSDTTRKRIRMEKIMRDKGYSPPPKGRTQVIGDWETMQPAWEEREPHNYEAPEHQSHLHAWSGRIAQEIGEEPVIVDITAPGFALGTYVPVEGRLESAVSEDAHETYRADDPYTERKSDQTAQAAIEALLKKKGAEEPRPPTPTKAQKMEARALQRERQAHYIEMERNHPNKPKADIYIRPAEEKDLGAIVEIFNWYIKNTAATAEIQPKNIAGMRERMDEARDEGFDMYVAVQKSGRSGANGHNHRAVSEPICGFTYANDIAGQHHSYIYTAEIFVFASHDHPHVGIGRCLFDRMMNLVDLNYIPKGGCEWRGEQLLTRREIKKILVNIPYWDKVEADNEDLQWKGNWLTGQGVDDRHFMKFEYQGTLKEFGWKQMKT